MEAQYELKEKSIELQIRNGVRVYCLAHRQSLTPMCPMPLDMLTASHEGMCVQACCPHNTPPSRGGKQPD